MKNASALYVIITMLIVAGIAFADYSSVAGSINHGGSSTASFNGTLVVNTSLSQNSSTGSGFSTGISASRSSMLSITSASSPFARTEASAALTTQLIQNNKTILSRSAAQVNCKTNFTISYLDNVSGLVPNASVELSQSITALNRDDAQVQADATTGNSSLLRGYIVGTYNPEVASIRAQVRAILTGNVTHSERSQLIASYNHASLRDGQCEYNVLKQIAQDKLADYRTFLSMYTLQEINLSAKGVQTGALQADISNANSTIVIPFSTAVNNATNATQLITAINEYCMFNGCGNGINAHLAAHFDYDKLVAIVNKIDTYNLTANQTASINSANGYLSVADSALVQVGTSTYKGNQSSQVWGNLRNASASIHLVLKQVK